MAGAMPAVDGAPGPDQRPRQRRRRLGPALDARCSRPAMTPARPSTRPSTCIAADPALKDALDMFEQSAGILGGVDGLIGWMGDTGVVVTADWRDARGRPRVGPDRRGAGPAAVHHPAQLRRPGRRPGRHHRDRRGPRRDDGHDVDLGSLAGRSPGSRGEALPVDARTRIPTDGDGRPSRSPRPTRSWSSAPSADFVKAVLDAGPGPSLADDARYQAAVGRVGAEHTGVAYVDIAGARTLIEIPSRRGHRRGAGRVRGVASSRS